MDPSPTMYEDHAAAEDHVDHGHAKELRRSGRLTTSSKRKRCPCCNSSKECLQKKTAPKKTRKARQHLKKSGNTRPKITNSKAYEDFFKKRQAELPQWTSEVSQSDTKWLGTQVWPLKHDSEPATETDDLIGIGTPEEEQCSCKAPRSVQCIRFHIAETKMKLKHSLGSAFYEWRFDQMGEEVCLEWTTEDEKRFKDIMKVKPSISDCFWAGNNVTKYFFKEKTRRDAVSYFFNVFILRLRSYQNRATRDMIDSDDEGGFGFGSLPGFGMEAVKGLGPGDDDFMECVENKQCFDFQSVEDKNCTGLECVEIKQNSDKTHECTMSV